MKVANTSVGMIENTSAAATWPYSMADAVTKANAPTVTGWTPDDPRINAKMKLFQAKMKLSSAAAAMPGLASGIEMWKKVLSQLWPSSR